MPVATEVQEWTKEVEDLSDEDKETLSKYDSPLKAHQGGAHAIRMSGSPDRTIENLGTMDIENLDDKQKETLHTHMRKIRGVPDTPEGYNIVRPEVMPEGVSYDIDLENWFRKEIHAGGGSNELCARLVNAWSKRQFDAHDTSETTAKEVEEKMIKEMKGQENFETAFGKKDDPNKIGKVKTCLLVASKELKLDYKDEQGFPQSHLLDELELNRKDGRFGDKPCVMKFVLWVANKFMAEGSTLEGGAPRGQEDPEKKRIAQNKKDFPQSAWMHK